MVYLFLADGFEEMEALSPLDLLRRGGVDVAMVSVHEGRKAVMGAHQIPVTADLNLSDCTEVPQAVILPGGAVGVENLGACEALCKLLKQYEEQGVTLCAICAAPTLLSKLGLLKGRRVACYPTCSEEVADGEYVESDVCVCERLITSKGPGTAVAFGVTLLEELAGPQIAEKIAAAACILQ